MGIFFNLANMSTRIMIKLGLTSSNCCGWNYDAQLLREVLDIEDLI